MICKRFALVGSGFIGQVHAASLARHEGSALTMVADAAPERAQALAIAEAAVQSLQHGQFVAVDDCR